MQLKVENCRKCNDLKPIVNRKYGLCDSCNWERLHPNQGSYAEGRISQQKELIAKMVQKAKPLKRTPLKVKPCRIKQISDKQKAIMERDEQVYEQVWNMKPHICEECDQPLGDTFKDEEGKIIDRFRYSHILGKDLYPEHRHNIHNFNLLCLCCHQIWEYGDKKSMKIFKTNQIIIKELKGIC